MHRHVIKKTRQIVSKCKSTPSSFVNQLMTKKPFGSEGHSHMMSRLFWRPEITDRNYRITSNRENACQSHSLAMLLPVTPVVLDSKSAAAALRRSWLNNVRARAGARTQSSRSKFGPVRVITKENKSDQIFMTKRDVSTVFYGFFYHPFF